MFKYIATFAIRFRIPILIALVLSTAYFGYRGTELTMSYKLAQLLPKSDSSYIAYENFKKNYGQDGSIVIVAVKDKDFWKAQKLKAFIKLSDDLKAIEGVERVASLKNAIILSRNDSLTRFETLPLIPEGTIIDQNAADSIRIELFNQPLYDKLLYNSNENTYLLLATLEKDILNTKERLNVVDRMEKLISAACLTYVR